MNTQSRAGKIARLPFAVREELNRRMEDGKAGVKVLEAAPGTVAAGGGRVEEDVELKLEPLCGVEPLGEALGEATVKAGQGESRQVEEVIRSRKGSSGKDEEDGAALGASVGLGNAGTAGGAMAAGHTTQSDQGGSRLIKVGEEMDSTRRLEASKGEELETPPRRQDAKGHREQAGDPFDVAQGGSRLIKVNQSESKRIKPAPSGLALRAGQVRFSLAHGPRRKETHRHERHRLTAPRTQRGLCGARRAESAHRPGIHTGAGAGFPTEGVENGARGSSARAGPPRGQDGDRSARFCDASAGERHREDRQDGPDFVRMRRHGEGADDRDSRRPAGPGEGRARGGRVRGRGGEVTGSKHVFPAGRRKLSVFSHSLTAKRTKLGGCEKSRGKEESQRITRITRMKGSPIRVIYWHLFNSH